MEFDSVLSVEGISVNSCLATDVLVNQDQIRFVLAFGVKM